MDRRLFDYDNDELRLGNIVDKGGHVKFYLLLWSLPGGNKERLTLHIVTVQAEI